MGSVSLAPYRHVLGLPGVPRLLIFAILARVPQTSSGVILTLHVVLTLKLGYGAAGLVATVATIGMGIGSPWRGRAVDRVGLRRALVPSVVVATLAWGLSPFATYPQLLVLAFFGGLLGVPVFSVTRQSLAVLVPGEHRRTVFSLDGMGTELSFIIGPTLGVLVATQASTRVALIGVAGGTLAAGLALMLVNPPTRTAGPDGAEGDGEAGPGQAVRVPRSAWFSPALLAVLAAAAGATVVLAGTDVAVVAHLREDGAVELTGLVFAAWGAGSMIGGLVYGGARRELSPLRLLLVLAVLTVPVGLAPGPYVLLLTILPAAALCAPVIAATAEGVSRLVPEEARGEALGWHGSALQLGGGLGAPLAGVAMDSYGAWSGFATVGAVGALLATLGLLVARRRGRPATPPAGLPAGERLPVTVIREVTGRAGSLAD